MAEERSSELVRNIDEYDTNDVMHCIEYVNGIYEHLKRKELAQPIDSDYMKNQNDINPGMRAILIDWLIDVTTEYHLLNDTFHLAVSLIDR